MKKTRISLMILIMVVTCHGILAQKQDKLKSVIESKIAEIEPVVIEWRHYLHEHPELSNREYKTAEFVADKLRGMGMEVTTGIAHTGVVGILKGGKPGPVIALRADMDGLPVKERVQLDWASRETGEYNGEEVPVMHACGHDVHMSILLGAAQVLSGIKDQVPGTLKFIFQPAEEGAPDGEEGGARLMVKQHVLNEPDAEVIFGLHIKSEFEVGSIHYKPEGFMAAVNSFEVKVRGKQTHGSQPWSGVDPVVTASLIINGLQTVVSRRAELTKAPAVVSVGAIHGGVRSNIIPEEVEFVGTIRTLDEGMREKILQDIRTTVIHIAESQGAEAEINIDEGLPVVFNPPDLTEKMLPSLIKAAGKDHVHLVKPWTGAEDFSIYQQEIPGLFFFLGGTPVGKQDEAFPHHTPDFFVADESMKTGIRAFCYLVLDYGARKTGK
jgi:amidohydrolase